MKRREIIEKGRKITGNRWKEEEEESEKEKDKEDEEE